MTNKALQHQFSESSEAPNIGNADGDKIPSTAEIIDTSDPNAIGSLVVRSIGIEADSGTRKIYETDDGLAPPGQDPYEPLDNEIRTRGKVRAREIRDQLRNISKD